MPSILPNLHSIVNQDGAVILDIPRNEMTRLNATGGYIWDKLQQGKTVDQIVHDLSMDSNTDPVIVERDVQEFVEELMAKHLVVNGTGSQVR